MSKTPTQAQIHARLTSFCGVARHLSFTQAALEMHLTTGAVSQQIKALEAWLGFRLFRRLPRRLELTEEGRRLLAVVRPAHEQVALEIERMRGGVMSGVVRLRSVPSFLASWVMPRLPKLKAQFPAIELRIEAEDSVQALRESEFDLAIDLNDGGYPGFQSTLLFEEEIFPVLSPTLLRGRPRLRTPAQLASYPLLHDMTAWRGSTPHAEWERYMRAVGAPQVDVRRGYMFNRNSLVIEAAIAGMGVAMARRTLTTDEIASGRLVAPFPGTVATGKRYCLIYAAGALDDRRVAAVHDWIVAQAQAQLRSQPALQPIVGHALVASADRTATPPAVDLPAVVAAASSGAREARRSAGRPALAAVTTANPANPAGSPASKASTAHRSRVGVPAVRGRGRAVPLRPVRPAR